MNETQTRVASDLRRLLADVAHLSESQERLNDESLVVLQCRSRSLGVGETGGLWVRLCCGGQWHRLGHESNSNVLELAVGFLITAD